MTFSNKIPNDKKEKKSTKSSGLEINNIVLKQIKEYPKVIHHIENDFKQRMVYNSSRIKGRRNNISKLY